MLTSSKNERDMLEKKVLVSIRNNEKFHKFNFQHIFKLIYNEDIKFNSILVLL